MKRKLLLFLLLLWVQINMFSAKVDINDGVLRYEVDTETQTATVKGVVSSLAEVSDLVIPDNITYNNSQIPVTSIGNNAFYNRSGLTCSLTIGENVQTIGNWAFSRCSGFTGSLTIPESVTSIGEGAFKYCSGFTGSLTIGNSVQSIGVDAFRDCSGFTGSLTIGNSVQSIGDYAFRGCSGFTGSLTIPNSVQTIGDGAFYECKSLTGSLTIGDSVYRIGISAFSGCSGFTGSLTIGKNVQYIGSSAFYKCHGFTGSLTIPNSVIEIGYSCFYQCWGFNGTLTIGYNVQAIKDEAFFACYGFTGSLIIPNSVTIIGWNAFRACQGLTGTLKIGDNVQVIGREAFAYCRGFTGSLTIPNSVTEIGEWAFSDCTGFNGSLTIGENVQTIGDSAFSGCTGLVGSLTIPNSVTSIGDNAFSHCSGFKGSLIFGENIQFQSIGKNVFDQSSYFTKIYSFSLVPPPITEYFGGLNDLRSIPLFVPAQSVTLYKEAPIWSLFRNINPIQIEATDIELSRTDLTLLVGQAFQLYATLTPQDATDERVWTIDEAGKSIVRLDEYNYVIGVAPGKATITVTAGKVSATCTVTVKGAGDVTVKPGEGTGEDVGDDEGNGWIVGKDVYVHVNRSVTMNLEMPEGLTRTPELRWELPYGGSQYVTLEPSDNKFSATFTGLSLGETSYTVISFDADATLFTGKVTVMAEVPMNSLHLEPSEITLALNALPQAIKPAYTPSDASMPEFTWTSSQPSVATVSQEGVVNPVGKGSTIITATTLDGSGLSAICNVKVEAPIDENFEFDFDESWYVDIKLHIGDTYQFKLKAQEGYALPELINWNSSDSRIVSVNENGLITALKIGLATITASAMVNGKQVKAECEVWVVAVGPESVKISAENLTLLIGQTDKLTATVEPSNTTYPTITWKSDNESVATVGTDGIITAISVGSANVTATCSGLSATCKVTVKTGGDITVKPGDGTGEGEDNGNGFISGYDLTVHVNRSVIMNLELPESISESPNLIIWRLTGGGGEYATLTASDNTLSATFTGKKVGNTAYTVSLNGQELISGKVAVIAEVTISDLLLEPSEITLAQNALPVQIATVITPENASMKEFTWTSSQPSVATISQEGVVTPVGKGSTIIIATALDGSGLSADCQVTVTSPIDENFEFDFDESVMGGKEGISLYIGDTYQFKPKVQEGYVLPDMISWSSSDETTVSVTDDGLISALKLGEVLITASATANGKEVKATCKVTVNPIEATSIEISPEEVTLLIGSTTTLTATVYPENATNQQILWSSSNPSVASVDATGTITALQVGEATITATCGSASATCKVTVNPIDASSIGLSLQEVTLLIGSTTTLTATVYPENATNQQITWSSSNPSVASVDATGTITANQEGEATITASCGSASATCKVTVTPVAPTSIDLNVKDMVLYIGQSETIQAIVRPPNTTYPTVTWHSDDESVATVSADGKVTGIKEGTATITATCANVSATCQVTVNPIPASNIEITSGNVTLTIGSSTKLAAKVSPDNTTHPDVDWSSSDNNIATIAADGAVTAVNIGTAIITAKCGNVSATCSVTVIPIPSEGIVMSPTSLIMLLGDEYALNATVYPETTTDKNVTWGSDNPAVASVSSSGVVTALSIGTANITARNGNSSATCQVTVFPILAEIITLNENSISIIKGNDFQLVATINPEDTTDKTIVWETDNENVATVSNNGFVKAIETGKTKITASCGDVSAVCEVVVADIDGVGYILNEVEQINVYTVNGVLIKEGILVKELDNLEPGIYIIQTPKGSFKIQK